ncbi:hydrogenase maturation protease [Pseudofrankia inefficax]|uniref:Hydrogenase maturation protease n=1 Tax=Pseudofrankia inefficax (strain DSM 45817 / CECT 9037 / DDB 130130 / EuI1c) TaxID=298654 RepID=E3J6F9_PSEI1|nr:hydrogenase maturation protease [Pseudofrankia inefficax]ADP80735.1 hydrogenase maturation protease [Pseudofrankia inefficax]
MTRTDSTRTDRTRTDRTRTLVAGVGNVLLGDDGFGVAVAGRLAAGPPLPTGVTVADYGIAGTHLAFDAAGGCDELLLIDAVPPWPVGPPDGLATGPSGAGPELAQPGELRLLELPAPAAAAWTATPGHGPEPSEAETETETAPASTPGDGHAMTPDAVLRLLALLGGGPERVLLVGCVPARVEEGLGLSPAVVAAVEPAARLVRAVLAGETGPRAQAPPGRPAQGRSPT